MTRSIAGSAVLPRQAPWLLIAAATLAFVLGFWLPPYIGGDFAQSLINNGLLTGILALCVAFIMHQCGLVLFGIAAWYGVAAYTLGILVNSYGVAALPASLISIVLTTLAAFVMGAIIIRVQPLAFMMICLSIAELFRHLVALPNLRQITGGSDGLLVMAEGKVFGIEAMDLLEPAAVWPLVWGATWMVGAGFLLVARSRFGTRLRAIRENEERMRFSAFDTYWPRVLAFTGAGFAAAVAGVIQVLSSGLASPEMFSIITSTNALLAAITGGVSSVAGPIFGGVVYTWAISEFGALGYSQLFTGIAVILVILLIPRGMAYPFIRWWRLSRKA